MRWLLPLLPLLLVAGVASADAPKSEARQLLERAIAGARDAPALAKLLAEVDVLIAKHAKDPDAHYVRGWILARDKATTREAVAAYDRAFALDPHLADAAYNAGVALGRSDPRQALVRFERALKSNPKHVDAAYNAGQAYYDLGERAQAAARWELAAQLAPEDFQIAKKLVQAYVALDKPAQLRSARDRVFALWREMREGRPAAYVYDQFTAGKYHVYVLETFDTAGEAAVIWHAQLLVDGKPTGEGLTLETSAALRGKGTPYILGVDLGGVHSTLPDHAWKTQPDYAVWKALVKQTVEARF